MTIHYADDDFALHVGDCLRELHALPDESVDSVVTDPPYGLEFMGREWDGSDGFRCSLNAADAGRDNAFGRASRTSPEYRAGTLFQEWSTLWAAECLRVLKPGGHLLAFGGTRTWHRLACAVEDAGFDVRDSIAWLYGSGFPKAKTVLKPAFEPIVVGRKPFAGSATANLAKHGTGALNIDGCRVGTSGGGTTCALRDETGKCRGHNNTGQSTSGETFHGPDTEGGRWPANVVLDEDMAAVLDQQSGTLTSGANPTRRGADGDRTVLGAFGGQDDANPQRGKDTGGASRFFYVAKAPTKERPKVDGVAHPTVKPLTLMRWLVRLATPPGGVVLEPFAGSGTTIEATRAEGFRCIAIERETDYLPLIRARLGVTDAQLTVYTAAREWEAFMAAPPELDDPDPFADYLDDIA